MSNKSEEELEKERLKNLILFKMYLTDEELTDVAPGVIITCIIVLIFIVCGVLCF
mgnify:CR=1 FL=1